MAEQVSNASKSTPRMKLSTRKSPRLTKSSVSTSSSIITNCRQQRIWADLPTELLALVLEKLVLLPHYIRFGAVCKEWRYTARDNHQDRIINCYRQPPMLALLPADTGEDRLYLYSVWEQKMYFHGLPIVYADCYSKRCCGSSYGWFAEIYIHDCSITLFNPFSRNTIRLPSIRFASEEVSRVTLSCDPGLHPNDWVVVATADSRLAVIRAGQDSWYKVRYPTKDMIAAGFYKGHLYVMDRSRTLLRIAIQDKASFGLVEMVNQFLKLRALTWPQKFYFVELQGNLLLIRRRYGVRVAGIITEGTRGFNVYKLRLMKKFALWSETKDLGEFCLFLGENKPICISTATFPDCQPNCIYYTSDTTHMSGKALYSPNDIGVFDLTTGHFRGFSNNLPPKVRKSSAVWISPNLV